jgi:hypothetical protein
LDHSHNNPRALPLIGGWLVDKTGSYIVTLTFLSISRALAAIFISKIKTIKKNSSLETKNE